MKEKHREISNFECNSIRMAVKFSFFPLITHIEDNIESTVEQVVYRTQILHTGT